jgi:hypothetical protein
MKDGKADERVLFGQQVHNQKRQLTPTGSAAALFSQRKKIQESMTFPENPSILTLNGLRSLNGEQAMRTLTEIEARIQQIKAIYGDESDQPGLESASGQVGRDVLTAEAQIKMLEWAKSQSKDAVERGLDELEQEAKRRFLEASGAVTAENEAEGRRLLDENHKVNVQCHELRWVLGRVVEHQWTEAGLG